MDILDQAMALEQDGERLYRSFAKDSSDEGAAYIFSRLADQEKSHYNTFKKIKERTPLSEETKVELKSVRDIFEGWRVDGARLNVRPSQVDLYRKALDVEEKSIRLYEENAKTADDEKARSAFLLIAGEERRHLQLIENIIEFVTKPDIWAENAEFGYRGEDYYL